MAKCSLGTNEISAPAWLAEFLDPKLNMAIFPAKLVASLFEDVDSVKITLTAAALADATSITVSALSGAIPSGTMLYFGESKEFALTTAAAAAGATSITVQALPSALESGDYTYYRPYPSRKLIPGGTLVGRTRAERDANTGFGPVAAGDDEIFLTITDIADANQNNDVELLKHGATIKENYLPGWTALNTGVNEVQTIAIGGTLSAGAITFRNPETGAVSNAVVYNGNLAAIQAALDDVYGSSKVTAAGTIASFTVTFDGSGVAGLPQPPVEITPDGLTGLTEITVTETTKGGKYNLELIRARYNCIKGVN